MIKISMRPVSVALGALLVSACGTMGDGQMRALSVAEEHPISVNSQVVSLSIAADPRATDMTNVDKARLRAFVDQYLANGHGPLTVTAPSGNGHDLDSHEMAADIRSALYNAGVDWSRIQGATYRTGPKPEGDDIILSFTRYVATPSACGDWSGMWMRNFANQRTPNYGCATMNNYAAMIADPHDLIAPADSTPPDAQARIRAMRSFRQGEITSSETDSAIQLQIAE